MKNISIKLDGELSLNAFPFIHKKVINNCLRLSVKEGFLKKDEIMERKTGKTSKITRTKSEFRAKLEEIKEWLVDPEHNIINFEIDNGEIMIQKCTLKIHENELGIQVFSVYNPFKNYCREFSNIEVFKNSTYYSTSDSSINYLINAIEEKLMDNLADSIEIEEPKKYSKEDIFSLLDLKIA